VREPFRIGVTRDIRTDDGTTVYDLSLLEELRAGR